MWKWRQWQQEALWGRKLLTRLVWGTWISLARCKTVYPIVIHVISCYFDHLTEIHSPSIMLLTNAHPEKSCSKAWNATPTKCFRLFRVLYQTYAVNVMKIHSSIFRIDVNRHDAAPSLGTVKQSSWGWNSLTSNVVVLCLTYPKWLIKSVYRSPIMLLAWIQGDKCNVLQIFRIIAFL